jgi:mono/diheme cytochrome c family protein
MNGRMLKAVRRLGASCLVLLSGAAISAEDGGKPKAFERVCGQCHGPDGRSGEAPPLVPLQFSSAEVQGIAREGRGMMPPLSSVTVSDEDLTAVIAWLESQTKK